MKITNFNETQSIVRTCLKTNTPALIIGDPGIGKSAMVAQVAKEFNLPVHTLIGSAIDSIDVGGIPFLTEGKLNRVPIKVIREAVENPVVLFLDELGHASGPVQSAFMRLVLDRVAGEQTLHPDTRVIAATNPPEQTPGRFDLVAPLINRFAITTLKPEHEEVLSYFNNLGSQDTEQFNIEIETFTSVVRVVPSVLTIDCPNNNRQWGSPRAWERALRARSGQSLRDRTLITNSLVGEESCMAYESILALVNSIPSVDEIVKDPHNVMVSDDPKKAIGSLIQIPYIARKSPAAGWIYANRLPNPELKLAAASVLNKFYIKPDKFEKEATPIRQDILAIAIDGYGVIQTTTSSIVVEDHTK